jgi:hypothetical protein
LLAVRLDVGSNVASVCNVGSNVASVCNVANIQTSKYDFNRGYPVTLGIILKLNKTCFSQTKLLCILLVLVTSFGLGRP